MVIGRTSQSFMARIMDSGGEGGRSVPPDSERGWRDDTSLWLVTWESAARDGG